MTFTDLLRTLTLKKNLWQSFCWIELAIIVCLLLTIVRMSNSLLEYAAKNKEILETGRIILTPVTQQRMVIERGSIVSNSYIEAMAKEVTNKIEAWTYESIADNYEELYREYYDEPLITKTKADLKATDRYALVREKQMVSIWKRDDKHSEYTWCEALKRACALVKGTTQLYVFNNQPYRTEDKTYVIFARDIHPNQHKNGYALLVPRLMEGNYEEMKQIFESAKLGRLNDE